MKEIIFSISVDLNDDFIANAFCYSITVQADTLAALRREIQSAVIEHFQGAELQSAVIRLHFTHHEELDVYGEQESCTRWSNAPAEYSCCTDQIPDARATPILGLRRR